MASTALNHIKDLSFCQDGINKVRELLYLEVLKFGSVSETLTMNYGVWNGKHIGGIGEFDLVGQAAKMCDPEWNHTNVKAVEEFWKLGVFDIAEELCADDFEETIAQYAMNTGTRRADLTDTDILAYIVEPKLKEAIEKGIWRYLWFGDTSAKNIADGGIITAGTDIKFFTAIDGLFKRLFALTAANPAQHITIAANSEATFDDQFDKMFEPGAATGVMKGLVYKSSAKLRQRNDKAIWCTQTYADALAEDVKTNNKGSELQWQSLFDGLISATRYNGQQIYALPIWDEMINSFENDGTKLNKPHRAIYASKASLLGGVESANDIMPDLDIWFSKDFQKNRIKGRESFGTTLWEPDLIQFAY